MEQTKGKYMDIGTVVKHIAEGKTGRVVNSNTEWTLVLWDNGEFEGFLKEDIGRIQDNQTQQTTPTAEPLPVLKPQDKITINGIPVGDQDAGYNGKQATVVSVDPEGTTLNVGGQNVKFNKPQYLKKLTEEEISEDDMDVSKMSNNDLMAQVDALSNPIYGLGGKNKNQDNLAKVKAELGRRGFISAGK